MAPYFGGQFMRGLWLALFVTTCPLLSAVADPAKYELLQEKVSDIPLKTQVVQDLVVTAGAPTEAEIRSELMRRYDTASARRGFRYHDSPTNIFIYIYATKEQANAGKGLWLGMVSKNFNQTKPDVHVNGDRLVAMSAPAVIKFGLTEATRKKVFQETAQAESRADKEATGKVPVNDKASFERYGSLYQKLKDQYKAQVRAKYGLSEDQELEISVEGVQKGWAF